MSNLLSSTNFQISDLQEALVRYGKAQGELVRKNPKLLKVTFDILKVMIDKNPVSGIAAFTSGAAYALKNSSSSKDLAQGASSAALGISLYKTTIELSKLVKLTNPTTIFLFVGAATVQKTGTVVSFVAGDSARSACIGAIAELAGAATIAAITAPTGVLAVLSFASLSSSTWNAYLICSKNSH